MNTVEEKIINATLSCIEKYGINKTTIRQIGQEADVNSAAINYYFRSKDILMEQAMNAALHNAFNIDDFKASESLPIKERLISIMDELTAGALKFPNITKAYFTELMEKNDYNLPIVKSCNKFFTELEQEIKNSYPEMKSTDIKMVLMQLTSSTFLFLGLFPGFYIGFPEVDVTNAKVRRDYVEKLVNKLL